MMTTATVISVSRLLKKNPGRFTTHESQGKFMHNEMFCSTNHSTISMGMMINVHGKANYSLHPTKSFRKFQIYC